MKNRILPLILALAMLLAACGGSGTDSDAGEELFTQSVIGSQSGCATCHSLEPGVIVIGPPAAGVGSRAAAAVSGQSAEAYLRESITAPDAHIAEGFAASIMPQKYAEELSAEQIDQLVAYMLTLE